MTSSSLAAVRKSLVHWVLVLLLVAIALVLFFPVLWIISTALKNRAETFAVPPYFIPKAPTVESFALIWKTQPFLRYFANSALVAVATVAVSLLVANMAAYGFSRFRLRGGMVLLMGILLTQMFPGVLFVLPFFIMTGRLGLVNSPMPLIVAHTSFALPFCTWMLTGYYDTIPKAIDESAIIDGCTRGQILRRILVPLGIPGNVATLIFCFLLSWNEFLFALTLATAQLRYTFPVGIALLVGEYSTEWNQIMAASLIGSVPAILLYTLMDKHLISGLVAGSVK
jgi:multiple sugar transport system permease protein